MPLSAQPWELAKDKEGISIYSRALSGWEMKESRAEMQISANLLQVENALKQAHLRKKWMYETPLNENLQEVSADEFYVYYQVDMPWPIENRDNVTHYEFRRLSDKELRVDFKSAPNKKELEEGFIRIKEMQGHWYFKELDNGQLFVRQQLVAHPGGSIPNWLAQKSVVEGPYKTMRKFRALLE
ncbi:START domain-containing protein [Saprospira sp. CCB-QB6]|uniref:START domain-containing protein n=1 Tax=Saprospira sp. CCB-QB6 TaxID=3023936 RepID=UPI00234BB75D|nr:START domain-containing protein [Saprospira sp. CCB-QB6]WCL80793.1 START domain-containing protein [Saprospira sp. CCB-QB6]